MAKDKKSDQPPSLFDNLDLFSAESPKVEEKKEVKTAGLTGEGPMRDLFDFNFRQYSAYVICSRAIPAIASRRK